jgi:hypothetical protein
MLMIGSSLWRRSCKWCSATIVIRCYWPLTNFFCPTADWWDAYVEAHEEPESNNWPEYIAAFCAHHVLQGVIKLKKKEYVNEYVTKFTQLSCYAPHEVDTDEKKQECFFNGLNDGLAYALEAREFENFQGMVNKALVLENRRCVIEHKRKLVRQH